MSATQRAFAAAALASCAVGSLGLFAPTPPPGQPRNIFVPGRVYGLGEQQVYLVERSQKVVVRFRDPGGKAVERTENRSDQGSVALTVEGFASDGSTVLAISVVAPAADSARGPAPDTLPQPAGEAPASPAVTADGRIADGGGFDALAPATLVVGAGPDTPIADGAKWSASGVLPLQAGLQSVHLSNAALTWTDDPGVLQVVSTGTFETRGSLNVPGFGDAQLRGAGSAAGMSFIDMSNRLLLGAAFTLKSTGNAVSSRGGAGTFLLSAAYTVKLMRYVPGMMAPPTPAGAMAPKSENIRTGPPDDLIRQGAPDELTRPAPTDNILRGTPLPQETPAPQVDASLPPVPVPVSSGAPLASPPAPPPTPAPTHTPH